MELTSGKLYQVAMPYLPAWTHNRFGDNRFTYDFHLIVGSIVLYTGNTVSDIFYKVKYYSFLYGTKIIWIEYKGYNSHILEGLE